MIAKTLMIQGASSSVGKSLLVTALCRIFARRGLQVSPFKAQNMSNNAAVCPDGSEIGRAQALQAQAAGTRLSSDLNPILIKPQADARSQIILDGRPFKTLSAYDYYAHKQFLWDHAIAALDRVRAQNDLVILEGAGSPAELNLKEGDIVNMAMARYTQAPVILVGDIDRGGIFAQLLGTLWLLEPEERQLVRGFLVNKFRGDIRLFEDGVRILEEKSGLPVFGVIPYLRNLNLPEEDAVALDRRFDAPDDSTSIDIVVVRLPLISNFDDFDPFREDPSVRIRYVTRASEVGQPQAVILPGTKSTMADLAWLRERGLDRAIQEHVGRGGALVGICGGYQMLGQAICDPEQVESAGDDQIEGLGFFPIETFFLPEKATYLVRARVTEQTAWLENVSQRELRGYEIHMGRTDSQSAWLKIEARNEMPCEIPEGSIRVDGKVWGCYLHGLFGNRAFRHAWLNSLGWRPPQPSSVPDVLQLEASLNDLADAVEAAVDIHEIERML